MHLEENVQILIVELINYKLDWVAEEVLKNVRSVNSESNQMKLACEVLKRIFIESHDCWVAKDNFLNDAVSNGGRLDFSNVRSEDGQLISFFGDEYEVIKNAIKELIDTLLPPAPPAQGNDYDSSFNLR